MQATVQITAEGMVIANLDTDDYAEDDETRALINLRLDDMLDQCARVGHRDLARPPHASRR